MIPRKLTEAEKSAVMSRAHALGVETKWCLCTRIYEAIGKAGAPCRRVPWFADLAAALDAVRVRFPVVIR